MLAINCEFNLIKIISELLEDRPFGHVVAFEIIIVAQILQQILLVTTQSLWYENADVHHQVTFSAAVTLNGGQSFASKAQCFSWLCTSIYLDSNPRSLQCWYLYLTAKGRSWEVKQQVINDVLTITNEGVVFFFFDVHLDIPADTVSLASVTLAWYVHDHAFSHACRYFNLNDFLAFNHSGAMTLMAFVLDDGAFTMTGWTFCLCLHHAQHGSYRLDNNTAPVTGRTGFRLTSVFCTTTMAVCTGNILFYFELFGNSSRNFL